VGWRRIALLEGIAGTAPAKARKRQQAIKPKVVRLPTEPAGFIALHKVADPNVRILVEIINELITWPGQPGYKPEPPVIPLTAKQQALYDTGKILFETTCAQCHQPHGFGQEGLAPPLVDSEWVLGPDHRLVRIALHGAHGAINVKGRVYDMDMPAFNTSFTDEQLAAILTYVRRSWDHTAAPVAPETVKSVRAETANREEAWSESELLKVP
jgi:mono/diheme cytochrome c family protein